MNGSVGSNDNHTLSPKQAQSLIEEIDNNTSRCKVQLEGKANDFLGGVSKIWADENAVSFAKEIAMKTDAIIQSLGRETTSIKNKICDICNKYSVAGGVNNTVSATQLTLTSAVNVGVVKDTFDGDRYGFADGGSSVQQVYDLLEGLKKDFQKCGDDLINAMSRTNAFGNSIVKNELIVFAGKVNSNITTEIFDLTKLANKEIGEAKRRYANVSHAIGGSNFSGGNNGNGSYSNASSAGAIAGSVAGAAALAGSVGGSVVGDVAVVGDVVGNVVGNVIGNSSVTLGEAASYALTGKLESAEPLDNRTKEAIDAIKNNQRKASATHKTASAGGTNANGSFTDGAYDAYEELGSIPSDAFTGKEVYGLKANPDSFIKDKETFNKALKAFEEFKNK